MANWRKTKTPGVYVAHQLRCPAFDSETARCRCEPSWRGRRRNRGRAGPSGRSRSPRTGARCCRGLGREAGADHVREQASDEPNLREHRRRVVAGVKTGRIGRARDAASPTPRRRSPTTRAPYRNFLRPEFGPMPADDIGEVEWQMWGDRLGREGLSRSRIATPVAVASAIYAWAMTRPPLRDPEPLRLVELPPNNERPRLRVAFAPKQNSCSSALEPEDAVPYAIAFYAGLRRSEIDRLEWPMCPARPRRRRTRDPARRPCRREPRGRAVRRARPDIRNRVRDEASWCAPGVSHTVRASHRRSSRSNSA